MRNDYQNSHTSSIYSDSSSERSAYASRRGIQAPAHQRPDLLTREYWREDQQGESREDTLPTLRVPWRDRYQELLQGAENTGLESEGEVWEDEGFNTGLLSAFWRNITISRDQTQASSYEQEKLTVLKEASHEITIVDDFDEVEQATWPTGSGYLASGSTDNFIHIWDPATGECISTLENKGHKEDRKIVRIVWSPEGNQVASLVRKDTIKIWDLATGQITLSIPGGSLYSNDIAWSPDGSQLAIASASTVALWDLATGRRNLELRGHSDWIRSISWSPDGSQLASGGDDYTLRVWDSTTGRCLSIFDEHTDWIQCVVWSPDANQIASGSDDETIKIWDLASSRCVWTLIEYKGNQSGIAWSPDSSQLASVAYDFTIRIWDTSTGKAVLTVNDAESRGRLVSVAWSPEGNQLASVLSDGEIKIWDVYTGQPTSIIRSPGHTLSAIAWCAQPESGILNHHIQPLQPLEDPLTNQVDSTDFQVQQTTLRFASLRTNRPLTKPKRLPELISASRGSFVAPSNYRLNLHSTAMDPNYSETRQNGISSPSQQMSSDNATLIRSRDDSSQGVGKGGDAMQQMAYKIAQLEEENKKLKGTPLSLAPEATYQIFHKVVNDRSTYLTEPSWTFGPGGNVDLRGHSPIPDVEGFLHRKPEIVFVVEKQYTLEHQKASIEKAKVEKTAFPDPKPASEVIRLLREDMIEALEEFRSALPNFTQDFPDWNATAIPSPFLFWYHYRDSGIVDTLSEPSKGLMRLLVEWIENTYGDTYSKVNDQFSRGFVSSSAMPFFVQPQDVMVSRQGTVIQGYVASSWARRFTPRKPPPIDSRETTGLKETSETWQVKAWSYRYDGRFYQNDSELDILLKFDEQNPEVKITTLEVFPIKFAEEELLSLLERRGEIVWKCRYKNLVSYEDDREDQLYGVRFIVSNRS